MKTQDFDRSEEEAGKPEIIWGILGDDDEEETLADKIGDRIVEGIYKVGDIICAPFEWMTEKIIDRM